MGERFSESCVCVEWVCIRVVCVEWVGGWHYTMCHVIMSLNQTAVILECRYFTTKAIKFSTNCQIYLPHTSTLTPAPSHTTHARPLTPSPEHWRPPADQSARSTEPRCPQNTPGQVASGGGNKENTWTVPLWQITIIIKYLIWQATFGRS